VTDQPDSNNVYFLDPESAAEMARLNNQDLIVTKGMGGLFPEISDPSRIQSVLDVACGPGGWAQEVAFAYPHIEVVGFDISEAMIEYANMQARIQNLKNASFHVMDIQKPLDFADASFDLVNARFVTFLPAHVWPPLVQEYARITRPGGFIRLTESEWWYFTNSPALERLNAMIIRSIKKQGSYSESGLFTGILPMLGRLLLDAGCINLQHTSHVIDFSYGTEAYETFRQSAAILFKLFQPRMVALDIATQEELDQTYEQMLIEMMKADFRGLMFTLTVLGERPASI
jgi:SAM-dependent methyltransferase